MTFDTVPILLYVVFLVVVVGGVMLVTSDMNEDKGNCVRASTGELKVRQPGETGHTTSEFCIIINT